MEADIVVDLQYGDSGKGKVTHYLAKTRKYSHVIRYNGGGNAGHTIFHNGRKFVTHQIPAGVFFGVRSIIGNGCVLDPEQFFKELDELEDGGVDTEGKVFIARNTHIVTESHRNEDSKDTKIGTTKRGNGPAYRDKYWRTGIRAESIPELKPFLIDLYEEFHHKEGTMILGEGAQGFGLDIDWGDYPFVTSSHCMIGGAILNGIPPQSIREVWGSSKIYETYVGAKKFEPDDPVFAKIREVGEEYGATTGRPRQVNWINLDDFERAIRLNGVTHVVLNKVDVLRTVGVWGAIFEGGVQTFTNEGDLKSIVLKRLTSLGIAEDHVFFSESKDRI